MQSHWSGPRLWLGFQPDLSPALLVFVGLTAYDTQKIKNMYSSSDTGELMGKKAAMGALTLYLDFINLFIMLLRLFGQRR